MKKSSKIILGIVIVTLLLGIAGLTAGVAMGARPAEFLNVKVGGINLSLGDNPLFYDGIAFMGNKQSDSFSSEEIDSLKISMGRGTVNILSSGDDTALYYEGQGQFSTEQKGTTLVIKDNGMSTSASIDLYLPDRVFEQVDMELGAGSTYITALSANKLNIELGLGEVEAEYLEGKNELEIQVGAGSFSADTCIGKKIDISCGMGSVQLTLGGKETDYDYTLSCGMGNITIGSSSISGLGREQKIDNQSVQQIDAECGMGQINIDFTDYSGG
ncbi:MAG: hypothetical protein ACI4V0_05300 [Lachnospiraceae bacterium]